MIETGDLLGADGLGEGRSSDSSSKVISNGFISTTTGLGPYFEAGCVFVLVGLAFSQLELLLRACFCSSGEGTSALETLVGVGVPLDFCLDLAYERSVESCSVYSWPYTFATSASFLGGDFGLILLSSMPTLSSASVFPGLSSCETGCAKYPEVLA